MYLLRREAKNTAVPVLLVFLLHIGFWLLLAAHQPRQTGENAAVTDREPITLWIIPATPVSEQKTRSVQRPEPVSSSHRSERMLEKPKPESHMSDMPAFVAPNDAANAGSDQPYSRQLDIESLKRAARGMAKDTARPALPGATEPVAPAEKFGREIEKGARKDCTKAYSDFGLLAIPFLIKDTVTDKGCRW